MAPDILNDRTVKLPNGTLVISNATEKHRGLYCCIVESGGPLNFSDEAELKLLQDPEEIVDLVFLI